jgi:hypothetical protein
MPNTVNVENRTDLAKFEINLGDVTHMTKKEINSRINSFLEKTVKPLSNVELTCTVKVSGEISIGGAKFAVSVEVSGPCSEIAKSGRMIANMVLDQIKSHFLE